MTSTIALIERLKGAVDTHLTQCDPVKPLMHEAATELTTLLQRWEKAEAMVKELRIDADYVAQMEDDMKELERQRDEAFERCANIAETPELWKQYSGDFEGNCIAAAIRAARNAMGEPNDKT